MLPQDGDDLLAADEDHQPSGGGGDDLLADQGPAEPLDEVQLRIDLVGAVHVDVDRLDLIEAHQRNPQLRRQVRAWPATWEPRGCEARRRPARPGP